jgi:hypothetical protein
MDKNFYNNFWNNTQVHSCGKELVKATSYSFPAVFRIVCFEGCGYDHQSFDRDKLIDQVLAWDRENRGFKTGQQEL